MTSGQEGWQAPEQDVLEERPPGNGGGEVPAASFRRRRKSPCNRGRLRVYLRYVKQEVDIK
ncbi:hypothetical protein B5E84_13280 [Lachnoclostridium sp. An14]|nr:hypothetical protein B5E84_13280 [Lachnoclostridium sp. An14]